jgi:hypothetical protein
MQEAPGVRGRYSRSGVNDQAVMTPRQLLSILRLSQVTDPVTVLCMHMHICVWRCESFSLLCLSMASMYVICLQALARIRLASRVTHEDVDEAIRLVSASV